MKDKEQVINEILQKSLDYLNNTEKFLSDEVPIYVNELMNFKVIEHLTVALTRSLGFGVIFGVFFALLLFIGFISGDTRRKTFLFLSCASLTLSITISTVANVNNFLQAYKAYSAPRVYLIDYLRNEIR